MTDEFSNEILHDGENLSMVSEPETVEDAVINDILTHDFDGERISEEEVEELLGE